MGRVRSPTTSAPTRGRGILAPDFLATTVGMFALIAFVAFEAMAVTTIMPTVARELDGVGLYALAFAAPLASGVIGMVAAGTWSDRRGPVAPLLVSTGLFSAGLLICAAAPTMEVLVLGRVLQGLGGGALTVGLYVLVGMVFPAHLQPSVFASFAAAWVLPALFGPALAAYVAHLAGWRWVFAGTVVLVGAALALISSALRRLATRPEAARSAPRSRLWWATLAAAAVLAVELLGSREGAVALLAVAALGTVLISVRPLLPVGSLRAARGLPAVIATRGLLSASFFATEAYVVFVLQERWDLTPGQAGLALTAVGLTWALASHLQARWGEAVSDTAALRIGSALVLLGALVLGGTVLLHGPALLAAGSYVVGGAGMGFGYPRTGVAMLAASGEGDRGFNSSALSIADALGGALALSLAGVAYGYADRGGSDPFLVVFALAALIGAAAALAAARTEPQVSEPLAPRRPLLQHHAR